MRRQIVLLPLALLLWGAPLASQSLPRLMVEAPERYQAVGRQLEALQPERFESAMGLIGLTEAGAPIHITLAPERSPEAMSAPSWVAGYAYGALGRIVLFVERTPSYPDGSLEALLDHEVAHVLIARATAHHEVPRWFNEGVSMVAGHAWGIADTSRLTLAVITRGDVSLAQLDEWFGGSSGEVTRAYALAGAMVREMLRRYDRAVVARVISGVRLGLPFEEAFLRGSGHTMATFEAGFWRRHSFIYRWIPLLGSSVTLWFGITLLALVAFRRRRRRDEEIRKRWEEEEEQERLRREAESVEQAEGSKDSEASQDLVN